MKYSTKPAAKLALQSLILLISLNTDIHFAVAADSQADAKKTMEAQLNNNNKKDVSDQPNNKEGSPTTEEEAKQLSPSEEDDDDQVKSKKSAPSSLPLSTDKFPIEETIPSQTSRALLSPVVSGQSSLHSIITTAQTAQQQNFALAFQSVEITETEDEVKSKNPEQQLKNRW